MKPNRKEGGSVYADCRGFRGGSEYRPGNSETVSATGLEGVCGTVPHGAAAAGGAARKISAAADAGAAGCIR